MFITKPTTPFGPARQRCPISRPPRNAFTDSHIPLSTVTSVDSNDDWNLNPEGVLHFHVAIPEVYRKIYSRDPKDSSPVRAT